MDFIKACICTVWCLVTFFPILGHSNVPDIPTAIEYAGLSIAAAIATIKQTKV